MDSAGRRLEFARPFPSFQCRRETLVQLHIYIVTILQTIQDFDQNGCSGEGETRVMAGRGG